MSYTPPLRDFAFVLNEVLQAPCRRTPRSMAT